MPNTTPATLKKFLVTKLADFLPTHTLVMGISLAMVQSICLSNSYASLTISHPSQHAQQPPNLQLDPSLYQLMLAEFAASRGNINKAISLYKQEALKKNSTTIFERALKLSLAHESVNQSLAFANQWSILHPEHVPAWFFVTHLALKAQNYQLATNMLSKILAYDPDADLSQILAGIFPTEKRDQTLLLIAIETLDTKNNPSLLVLHAGLLAQFNQLAAALQQVNKALDKKPNITAFITLKADILQKMHAPEAVDAFLNSVTAQYPNNKSLQLYHIRYLLKLGDNPKAWQKLLATNKHFTEDNEIRLLTALVGIDTQQYPAAEQRLIKLLEDARYSDQAFYYLGISQERQQHYDQALIYFTQVRREDLVVAASKKVVTLAMINNDITTALTTAQKLRQNFPIFAKESYLMEAKILANGQQTKQASTLLTQALKQFPDNSELIFAYANLLDNQTQYHEKRNLLARLIRLKPKNASYHLSYGKLLASGEHNSADFQLAQQQATTVMHLNTPITAKNIAYHVSARQLLALIALRETRYQDVIDTLTDDYTTKPSLKTGLLLLDAYIGLNDDINRKKMLQELQQHFGYTPDYSPFKSSSLNTAP